MNLKDASNPIWYQMVDNTKKKTTLLGTEGSLKKNYIKFSDKIGEYDRRQENNKNN